MKNLTAHYAKTLSDSAALLNQVPFFNGITDPDEHAAALELVEYLLDHDEDNPLIELLADKIQAYEENAPEFAAFNARIGTIPLELAVLRTLMDQHHLNLSSFPNEIGGKSLVSMILNGTRTLTLEHMRALSARFGIPVASFIEDTPPRQRRA